MTMLNYGLIANTMIRNSLREKPSIKTTDALKQECNMVTPKQVYDVLQIAAKTSAYNAKRIAQNINAIYVFGGILGYASINPAYALSRFLPKVVIKHRPHLPIEQLPKLLQAVDKTQSGAGLAAFWLIVYTAVRRSEACHAKRDEFDLDTGVWTVPASRMKMRNAHSVPLSPQVVKILQAEFARVDSPWAFASPHHGGMQPINNWTPLYLIRRTGFAKAQSLHGFRHQFSTHAHDNGWSPDVIELCLAHKIHGVRGVYNHARMMDKRAELMAWWANEIDGWRGV
ncbi:MAG: site-specific integrase [Moraxella sp.]|nr:site-specific integrase [Moraxella sp.]